MTHNAELRRFKLAFPLYTQFNYGYGVCVKVKEGQKFFNFFFAEHRPRIATGELSPYELVESWEGKSERVKSLGQVCTPSAVGKLMARWVTSTHAKCILDPAVGVGNLLHECCLLHPKGQYFGIDRDKATLDQTARSAPHGAQLICADYLKSDIGLMEGIIANPPYVKAQYLDYTESDWRFFEERFGTGLDRLTNLYALFLLKIWEDLALQGRAAVIIPSEFLNANFGMEIKDRLLRTIRPVGIAIFDTAYNVFNQAMTTSCIVFMEKGRGSSETVWAHKVHTVDEADQFVGRLLKTKHSTRSTVRYVNLTAHKPSEKWLNLILNKPNGNGARTFRKKVGDYFRCLRGIATGSNSYFCLSKAEMERRGLSMSHFVPCITKAPDAAGLVFSRDDFRKLVIADRCCYLLSPKERDAALDQYLKEGIASGISQRYLPSHRPVWYEPENRPPADIWVAVFSRETVKYILNTAGVRNLTCFHGLYCREKSKGLPVLMTLFLNSSAGREAFFAVNRFYGDGLNKLEPKDVEAMPCPELPSLNEEDTASLVRRMVELKALGNGERQAALDDLADEMIESQEPQFAACG